MGPSFLCFGATRSGTTFLHAHLRAHPQVWMPPQKEIHYFNARRAHGIWSRKHLRHLRDIVPHTLEALRGKRSVAEELAWQLKYLLGRRSDAWFASLCEAPPGFITGWIEPTYAPLPSDQIRKVRELMPEVRLLYLMRDPLERTWSSVTKSRAKNKSRPMAQVSETEIFEKLDRSSLEMSRYIEHIERWEKEFPRERFLFGFFEEMVDDPLDFLNRICRFLEIDPLADPDLAQIQRPINDTRRFKVEIPPHLERYIAEQLLDPTRALHERFRGYATEWYLRMERVLAS